MVFCLKSALWRVDSLVSFCEGGFSAIHRVFTGTCGRLPDTYPLLTDVECTLQAVGTWGAVVPPGFIPFVLAAKAASWVFHVTHGLVVGNLKP
jgi:hypothetical protein